MILRVPGQARPDPLAHLPQKDVEVIQEARRAVASLLAAMQVHAPSVLSRSGNSTRLLFGRVSATAIGRQENGRGGSVVLKIRRPDLPTVRINAFAERWNPGPRTAACDVPTVAAMVMALASCCLAEIEAGPAGRESPEMKTLLDVGRTHLLRTVGLTPDQAHRLDVLVTHPWDGSPSSVTFVRSGNGHRERVFRNGSGLKAVPALRQFAAVETRGWGTNDLSVVFSSPKVSVPIDSLPTDATSRAELIEDAELDRLPMGLAA